MSRRFNIVGVAYVFLVSVIQAGEPSADAVLARKAALQIDYHVAAFYRAKQLSVPGVTDDATFMRRAFLVSIGRIPTAEEALDFMEIEDSTKREALINYLMQSKGYSSHMTNWAFDLLRVTDRRVGNGNNRPYRHWIRQAMTDNMPWDKFTESLVAAAGDGWNPQTASVGYYTRDRGMPLDNLSNTMRVFLGTRMECAQCHDDPFGKTERHDFYELAAFTHGQESMGVENMRGIWNELSVNQQNNPIEYKAAKVFWEEIYGMSLSKGGVGKIDLPSDYQYRDAAPGEIVGARTPFGKIVRISEKDHDGDGREQLAKWIVSKTGDQFSSVIANRMWKRIMGKGIYDPVDEFITADKTNSPALVGYLSELMVEVKYDLRLFQQILLSTRTFQFNTNPKSSTVESGDDFHGRKIERLSSEQIWDSLITLASGDPDQMPLRKLDDRIHVGEKVVMVGVKTMTQLSEEVIALKSEAEVRAYLDKFISEISNESESGSDKSMMAMVGKDSQFENGNVRASELPSPPPRDHFLYLFGASDREVVDASSREPNMGQVLSMMNGYVQRELVHQPTAHLYRSLEHATSHSEKIRRLYLSILSRPPTADELSFMLEEINTQGEDGFQNIVSSLIMSSEFLFLQ